MLLKLGLALNTCLTQIQESFQIPYLSTLIDLQICIIAKSGANISAVDNADGNSVLHWAMLGKDIFFYKNHSHYKDFMFFEKAKIPDALQQL